MIIDPCKSEEMVSKKSASLVIDSFSRSIMMVQNEIEWVTRSLAAARLEILLLNKILEKCDDTKFDGLGRDC